VAAAYFAEPLRHLHDPAHAAWFKRRKKDREKEPHVLPSKKKNNRSKKQPVASLWEVSR
jgi:hypothetical protein